MGFMDFHMGGVFLMSIEVFVAVWAIGNPRAVYEGSNTSVEGLFH